MWRPGTKLATAVYSVATSAPSERRSSISPRRSPADTNSSHLRGASTRDTSGMRSSRCRFARSFIGSPNISAAAGLASTTRRSSPTISIASRALAKTASKRRPLRASAAVGGVALSAPLAADERAFDGPGQAAEPVLGDVVHRAVAHRHANGLLADLPGDEQAWQVGRQLGQDPKHARRVEAGELVVGDRQVVVALRRGPRAAAPRSRRTRARAHSRRPPARARSARRHRPSPRPAGRSGGACS